MKHISMLCAALGAVTVLSLATINADAAKGTPPKGTARVATGGAGTGKARIVSAPKHFDKHKDW